MAIIIREINQDNCFDVCELTSNKDGTRTLDEEFICSNAMSLAEAKYFSFMRPMAIYNEDILIGFFMYKYFEESSNIATICRYMIDYKYLGKGLGRESFRTILNYFKKDVKVKSVELMIDAENIVAKNLYISFGFSYTGKIDHDEYYYRLDF